LYPTKVRSCKHNEDLAPLNPRMIYASLTAYSEAGPDVELEGFDVVAWWARSGLMDLVRAPGDLPGGSVPGTGNHPTAVALDAAIVTALLGRERTGQGSEVHTSLLRMPAPDRGQHTDEVLTELDSEPAAIEWLRRDGML
jgi:crotonobetainyl-CoA:carnitine CoA-transferase CaiB-like acyl-CoA transferase